MHAWLLRPGPQVRVCARARPHARLCTNTRAHTPPSRHVTQVQEAAANTLAALVHLHPANAAAAAAAGGSGVLLPHAFGLLQSAERQPGVARATAALLKELLGAAPELVVPALLQPGGMSSLLRTVEGISRQATSPGTPAAREQVGVRGAAALLALALLAGWAGVGAGAANSQHTTSSL